MSDKFYIIQSLKKFLGFRPIKLSMLFAFTLIQGLLQGFSLVLIIPILQIIDNEAIRADNSLVYQLTKIINLTGATVTITSIVMFVGVLLIISYIVNYAVSVMQSSYLQEYSANTRERLYKKTTESDWNYLSSISKHNVIQILTTEIPKSTQFYFYFLSLSIILIFVATHVALAFTISPMFTLFIVFAGIVMMILMRTFLKRADKLGTFNVVEFRSLLKQSEEFWQTLKSAKVHNTEEFYSAKYKEVSRRVMNNQNQLIKNRAFQSLMFSFAGLAVIAIVMVVAVYYFELKMSAIVILIALFARIFPRFSLINNDLNMIYSNMASVRLVEKFESDLKISREKPKSNSINKTAIKLNDVNYGYIVNKSIFSDFNTFIPLNSITGIIGPSGSGKTTLLDLISGLIKPQSGSVENAMQDSIAYIPQEVIFPDGTIRQNLIWDSSELITDDKIYHTLEKVNALHLIQRHKSELDTYISNYNFTYSGGERQRLAIARALLRNPKLLILDEATSSLDFKSEEQIMQILRTLSKDVTIIVVTHNLQLTKHFDYIIELNKKGHSKE